MYLYNLKEDRDYIHILLMLNIDFDEFDDGDIEIVLMSKLSQIDEESVLIKRVIEIVNLLLLTPDSVLRPYQQHFVTEKYDR